MDERTLTLTKQFADILSELRTSTEVLVENGVLKGDAFVHSDDTYTNRRWLESEEVVESEIVLALRHYSVTEIFLVLIDEETGFSSDSDDVWNSFYEIINGTNGAQSLVEFLDRLQERLRRTERTLNELEQREPLLRTLSSVVDLPDVKKEVMHQRRYFNHYLGNARHVVQVLKKRIRIGLNVLDQSDITQVNYRIGTGPIDVANKYSKCHTNHNRECAEAVWTNIQLLKNPENESLAFVARKIHNATYSKMEVSGSGAVKGAKKWIASITGSWPKGTKMFLQQLDEQQASFLVTDLAD